MEKPDSSQHFPRQLGQYKVTQSLGKGGMGEVFLAWDPTCSREVALKQIRKELSSNKTLQERFLREAHLASQLCHPSIIPIYMIHSDSEQTFYTMPYVEGETLKEVLKTAYEEEKAGEVKHPIGSSIPALAQIFLNVCQAIAYCHSKKILHRDLKPDNIIIGKYGEVLILDWGLACTIGEKGEVNFKEVVEEKGSMELTKPGKIAGTLAYIAPERVLGEPSSVSTDVYSLGVILYQILTLQLPFQRPSIQSFRKMLKRERLIDPQEIAPYRDIPQHLSDIAKRCLQPDPKERFQNTEELISELKSYIEGKPEWIPAATLSINRKEDWEFQENIFLAKHIAITRSFDSMQWVSMMISQGSFSGNTKLKTRVCVKKEGSGIGFLIGIPEASEREGIEEGYCLWVGSFLTPSSKLFRSNIQVMEIPGVYLQPDHWHEIKIDKVDNHLRFYLDGEMKCHYISHIPLSGTHIGVLYRDADFQMEDLAVFVGSQNVTVNCLAIPDAFLANRNYSKALSEYRRIGYSFDGRSEGREALFRAGITLLEEASSQKKKKEKERLYLNALEEFGKLRATPAAPLEYLGKSLVYKDSQEIEEEIKCLELCVRKYPKHPLLKIVIEHIIFRLHEASLDNRPAAFEFALLALRHLPQIFQTENNHHFLKILKENLEPLPFILPSPSENANLAVQLAFWLAKPITLIEIIENSTDNTIKANAFYALLMLGYAEWVRENIHLLQKTQEAQFIEIALAEKGPAAGLTQWLSVVKEPFSPSEVRCALYLFESALRKKKELEILPFFSHFKTLSFDLKAQVDLYQISALLLQNQWKQAQDVLESYPTENLIDNRSPLFSIMGCWLWHREGKEIALSHFSGGLELSHPSTATLISAFLDKKIDLKKEWIQKSFFWEKLQLFRQLQLFYHCKRQSKLSQTFFKRLKKEIKRVQLQHTYP